MVMSTSFVPSWRRKLRGLVAGAAALAFSFLAACDSGVSDALLAEHRLSYDGNGSTHGSAPTSVQMQTGTTTIVSAPTNLERPGYTFTTWNTAGNGTGDSYASGALFLMGTADVTLYAQWQVETPTTYTVTYHGNTNTGGTAPTDANGYELGQTVSVLGAGTLEKTGFVFDGWNTMANGQGVAYAAAATFAMGNADFDLYAQWAPEPVVTVVAGDTQLELSWPAVTDATEYRVYYGTADDVGAATLWNDTAGTITARTATVTGLVNTTQYYVWVAGMVSGSETFVNADSATGTPATGTLSVNAAQIAPSEHALHVALDKTVVVPFNLNLDANTVSTTTVTVDNGAAVDIVVAVGSGGDTIEITPDGGTWTAATTYTVTIDDAVTASTSETMNAPYSFTFTTLDTDELHARWTWNNDALDQSGNSRDATVANVTYDNVEFREGTHALTTSEAGDSDATVAAFDLGDAFTYTTWFRINDVWTQANDPTAQTFFATGEAGSTSDGIKVYVDCDNDADRIVVETGDGTNGVQVWTATINNLYGTWHHLTVSVNRTDSDVRIYLDGEELGLVDGQFNNQSHYVMPNFANNATLRLNNMIDTAVPAHRLDGNVDDVRIYNRLFTAGEARNVSRER